ncbi:hypothetical protein M3Y97_00370000 [Aphelenchoides bicaudatus]|nr:hypothetical protein M3Y97_00370000 [Aphelenchoides bicaudatus]
MPTSQMLRHLFRSFLLFVCLSHLLLATSAAPVDQSPILDDNQLTDQADRGHSMERRAFLQISGGDLKGAVAERSKEFGVGNNFVRHLRLLTRMSKRRRPFLNTLFEQDTDCINN